MVLNTRGRALALAATFATLSLVGSACTDIDASAAMADVVKTRTLEEDATAAAQAEQEAAVGADSMTDAEVDPTGDPGDPASSMEDSDDGAMSEASTEENSSVPPATEVTNEGEDTPISVELDAEGLPGETATVPTGTWTVAEDDVGVRVREIPAGTIMGFIIRGDIARTTGRARILNEVAWAEVELRDGTIGWMAIDLLESAEDTAPFEETPGDAEAAGADDTNNQDADSDPGDGDADAADQVNENGFSTQGLTPIQLQPQAAFVSDRTEAINIFTEPRLDSDAVRSIERGDEVMITNANGWRNGEIPFVLVRIGDAEGWVDGRYLDVNGN